MKRRDEIEKQLEAMRYDANAYRAKLAVELEATHAGLSPAAALAAADVLEQERGVSVAIAVTTLRWVLGDGPMPDEVV